MGLLGMAAVVESLPANRIRNCPIRYAGSITIGIGSTFPEEVRMAGGRQMLFRKVQAITPYMVALNEAADIGISAHKRFEEGSEP